jgi:hypothetical protein
VDEALFAEILRTAMTKEVSAAALDALLTNLCVLQLKNLAGNLVPKADQANTQCVVCVCVVFASPSVQTNRWWGFSTI